MIHDEVHIHMLRWACKMSKTVVIVTVFHRLRIDRLRLMPPTELLAKTWCFPINGLHINGQLVRVFRGAPLGVL